MKSPQLLEFDCTNVRQDVAPAEVGPESYTFVNNMQWHDGKLQRSLGVRVMVPNAFQPAGTPRLRYIQPVQVPAGYYWMLAGTDGTNPVVIAHDGQLASTITPPTIWDALAPDAGTWSGASLHGLPVLNHQLAQPAYWDGAVGTPMAPLPDWPTGTIAKAMRAFRNHLFAFNLEESGGTFPDKLLWSDAADPGAVPASWTPAPDNEAGDATLADTLGDIVDAHVLRDQLMIYKDHATHVCSFVGGNNVFSFRKLFDTIGCFNLNCVAEYQGRHVVLTDGDLIIHDGQNPQSLVDKNMRDWLFNQIADLGHQVVHVVSYPQEDEVWVCFRPEGSSEIAQALVWNARDNACGVRELRILEDADPASPWRGPAWVSRGRELATTGALLAWDPDTQSWDQDITRWGQTGDQASHEVLVYGGSGGEGDLYTVDSALDIAGSQNIRGAIEKTSSDLGDPATVKMVTRVWPKIVGAHGAVVYIRLGSQMQQTDPVAYGAEVAFIIGTHNSAAVIAAGRYISIRFRSEGLEPWRLQSYELELGGRARY